MQHLLQVMTFEPRMWVQRLLCTLIRVQRGTWGQGKDILTSGAVNTVHTCTCTYNCVCLRHSFQDDLNKGFRRIVTYMCMKNHEYSTLARNSHKRKTCSKYENIYYMYIYSCACRVRICSLSFRLVLFMYTYLIV